MHKTTSTCNFLFSRLDCFCVWECFILQRVCKTLVQQLSALDWTFAELCFWRVPTRQLHLSELPGVFRSCYTKRHFGEATYFSESTGFADLFFGEHSSCKFQEVIQTCIQEITAEHSKCAVFRKKSCRLMNKLTWHQFDRYAYCLHWLYISAVYLQSITRVWFFTHTHRHVHTRRGIRLKPHELCSLSPNWTSQPATVGRSEDWATNLCSFVHWSGSLQNEVSPTTQHRNLHYRTKVIS